MFLVDSAEAQNWDSVITIIKTVLERAEAEIVSIKKWDDRKLAYGIKGKNRGTYILCYFRADGDRIREIERDVHLSERIMRVLILSTETREKQDIEKDLVSQKDSEMETSKDSPAEQAAKEKHKAAPKAAEKVEVEQGAAERERERSGTPEAPAAGESEQAEPEEDIGRINELGGQEAKED
jgi:small subunit ribosomal protein S6